MVRLGIQEHAVPIVAKAKMLKRHLPGLLSNFAHRLTNALARGSTVTVRFIRLNRTLEGFDRSECIVFESYSFSESSIYNREKLATKIPEEPKLIARGF